MDPQSFRAPYFSKERLCTEADNVRARYWRSGDVPVDIEAIIEFDLELDIVPIAGLRSDNDMDAFLASDWRTIYVDDELLMDRRYRNRLRFSFAHEMGHYFLHGDVFRAIPRASVEEWIGFMRDMPEKEYSFIEYHANEFAGRFLVPFEPLKQSFESAISEAEAAGVPRDRLYEESHLSYLANPLARYFDVSGDVIERRLIKEGLWPVSS